MVPMEKISPTRKEEQVEGVPVEGMEETEPASLQTELMVEMAAKAAAEAVLAADAITLLTKRDLELADEGAMDMLRFMLRGELNENGLFERG